MKWFALVMLTLLAACPWFNEEDMPCLTDNHCLKDAFCVGATATEEGNCSRTPPADDDDSAPDDDDDDDSAPDDDDSTPDDDDSTPDDDDSTPPPDDDDVPSVVVVPPTTVQMTFGFEVSSGTPQDVAMTVTAEYFEGSTLDVSLCSRRLTATGTVTYGPGVVDGCDDCTGRMEFEAAGVVDHTALTPLENECDLASLEDGLDVARIAYGLEPGPGRDFLTLGLIDSSTWQDMPNDFSETAPGFNAEGRQAALDSGSDDFVLTHAIVFDGDRIGSYLKPGIENDAEPASGRYYGLGYMWIDTSTNNQSPDSSFLLGSYSGQMWWLWYWDF